jgi:hypothetical protein
MAFSRATGIEPKVIKVEQSEPAFNTADPKVSDFIAGAVVKNLLSYPAAVRQRCLLDRRQIGLELKDRVQVGTQ